MIFSHGFKRSLGKQKKTRLNSTNNFCFLSSENRKKEINFVDLMKQMHKQLPLNIISQFVNINKLEYDEMTKILKNTLTEKGIY